MKTLSLLIFIVYLNVLADDISLTNGYVLRNVKVENTKGPDKTWVISGRDVQIYVPNILISSQNIKNVDNTSLFIYEPDPESTLTDFQKNQNSKSNDSLFVITRSGEIIHYNTFFSSESSITCKTNYGTVIISKSLIISNGQVGSEHSAIVSKSQNLVTVSMFNGETFQGEFLSSSDSSVTYRTNIGTVTVKKNDILSTRNSLQGSTSQIFAMNPNSHTKRIVIKEYKSLPLLLFTIAGGVWAYSLFSDAKDYSNAEDVFNAFGSQSLANEAATKCSEKLWTGIGVSILSLVFFAFAITPSESYIEQPVTVIPTSNGLRVIVQF
jgi:hypothetical protein